MKLSDWIFHNFYCHTHSSSGTGVSLLCRKDLKGCDQPNADFCFVSLSSLNEERAGIWGNSNFSHGFYKAACRPFIKIPLLLVLDCSRAAALTKAGPPSSSSFYCALGVFVSWWLIFAPPACHLSLITRHFNIPWYVQTHSLSQKPDAHRGGSWRHERPRRPRK